MERFKNGFYFFKKIVLEDEQNYRLLPGAEQSFGCVSYFRTGTTAAMDITPEGLHMLPVRNASVKCLIITEEAHGMTAYTAGEIRVSRGLKINRQNRNTRPEYANVCAVVLIAENKPIAAALAEKTLILPAALFRKDEQGKENTALQKQEPESRPAEDPPQDKEKNIKRLEENPDNNKETILAETGIVFDPFETTNPAYKWFACPDPQKFINVLTAFSVTLPLTLEKNAREAMTAYGHLLTGNYYDKKSDRTFLILGIPSDNRQHSCAYNERYDAARWMPAAARYNNADNNGYHLYYIDAETSAIVKVVVH